MRLALILSLLYFVFLTNAHAEELNAGFVQGLWYSSELVTVKEPTRIYVALRNNTEHDLSGTVRFAIDGIRISTFSVSALPGRLVEAWADWTPNYGEHTITASFANVRLHKIGEEAETVEVVSTLAEDVIFVDYDTDNDGIPNKDDTDDDGDGMSDGDEEKNGTDPLVKNKKVEEKKENESNEASEEQKSKASESKNEPLSPSPNSNKQGLERYMNDGTIRNVLTTVTEKVNETKSTLDNYRLDRKSELDEDIFGSESEIVTTTGTTTIGENATITRTQLPQKQSFVSSVFSAFKSLIDGIFTFILWIISGVLGYPALVQLLVLILVLVFIYKIARRVGGRPPGY